MARLRTTTRFRPFGEWLTEPWRLPGITPSQAVPRVDDYTPGWIFQFLGADYHSPRLLPSTLSHGRTVGRPS